MPSQVSLTPPQDNVTDVSASFWNTELGKIVNALNQLIQGLFGSTDITTTGDMNARDFNASRNVNVGNDLTVSGDASAVNAAFSGDATVAGAVAITGSISAGSGIAYTTGFGAYETTNVSQVGGSSTPLALDTIYQAAFDGYISGSGTWTSGDNVGLKLSIGATSGTLVDIQTSGDNAGGSGEHSVGWSVKNGEFWRVEKRGSQAPSTSAVIFRPNK